MKVFAERLMELRKERGLSQATVAKDLRQESTASMMRTFGTYAMMTGKLYDLSGRIEAIDGAGSEEVMAAARYVFDMSRVCASTVSSAPDSKILEIFKGR